MWGGCITVACVGTPGFVFGRKGGFVDACRVFWGSIPGVSGMDLLVVGCVCTFGFFWCVRVVFFGTKRGVFGYEAGFFLVFTTHD